MSYKWLYFDLDGTLWDFAANSEYTLRHIMRQMLPELVPHEQEFLDLYHHYNDILWVEYGCAGSVSTMRLPISASPTRL